MFKTISRRPCRPFLNAHSTLTEITTALHNKNNIWTEKQITRSYTKVRLRILDSRASPSLPLPEMFAAFEVVVKNKRKPSLAIRSTNMLSQWQSINHISTSSRRADAVIERGVWMDDLSIRPTWLNPPCLPTPTLNNNAYQLISLDTTKCQQTQKKLDGCKPMSEDCLRHPPRKNALPLAWSLSQR